MSATCMQEVIDPRTHCVVRRRRPHVVPEGGTGDPNNGYAYCSECGAEVYVGTGRHPNLGVPLDQVEAEIAYLRQHG